MVVSLVDRMEYSQALSFLQREPEFPGTAGISQDIKAMAVMAKMQPSERLGLGIVRSSLRYIAPLVLNK
eukprot:4839057-Pyramimonas_sp.AAC.2